MISLGSVSPNGLLGVRSGSRVVAHEEAVGPEHIVSFDHNPVVR